MNEETTVIHTATYGCLRHPAGTPATPTPIAGEER